MPWARLDDNLNSHPKFTALTGDAFRLWAAGAVYCAKALSDGFMPAYEVDNFPLRGGSRNKAIKQLLQSLVAGKGPLWHAAKQNGVDGFAMHDYLDHNDSREKILKKREQDAQRVKNWRQRQDDFRAEHEQDDHGSLSGLNNASRNALRNSSPDAFNNTPTTTTSSTTPTEQQKSGGLASRGTSENQDQRADDRAPIRKRLTPAEKRILAPALHKTLDVSPELDDASLKEAVSKLLKLRQVDDVELQAIVDAVRAERAPRARREQSVSPLMRDTLRLAGIATDEIFAKFYGATFAPDPMTGHAVLVMPTQESRDAIDYGLAVEIAHAFRKAAKTGLTLRGIVVAPRADEFLEGYRIIMPTDDVVHLCELAGISRFFTGTVFHGSVLGEDVTGTGVQLTVRPEAFDFIDRQFREPLADAAARHLGAATFEIRSAVPECRALDQAQPATVSA